MYQVKAVFLRHRFCRSRQFLWSRSRGFKNLFEIFFRNGTNTGSQNTRDLIQNRIFRQFWTIIYPDGTKSRTFHQKRKMKIMKMKITNSKTSNFLILTCYILFRARRENRPCPAENFLFETIENLSIILILMFEFEFLYILWINFSIKLI